MRLRQSKTLRLALCDTTLKGIFDGAIASRANQLRGANSVHLDLFFALWHDCRRAKEEIEGLGDLTTLDDYARDRYDEAPDWRISDLFASAYDQLNVIQRRCGDILQIDSIGAVTRPYCYCKDTGPFIEVVYESEYFHVTPAIDDLLRIISV